MIFGETGEKVRLDKWLWHARFFKTRSLAAKMCKGGKLRLNGSHNVKASALIKPGDVLTFAQANQIMVVKMLAAGVRRGPATEAQALYEDLTPPPPKVGTSEALKAQTGRDVGTGRPTKADRRATDRLKNWD
jgi:ribosome-associated heat shock protein Hsp15